VGWFERRRRVFSAALEGEEETERKAKERAELDETGDTQMAENDELQRYWTRGRRPTRL